MPYIGQPPVSGDTTKSFRLLDNLASFTLTFDATSSSVVDTSANTLTFANHRFVTAQRVTYSDGGGTAIGGLTDGTAYFIIKVDPNTIQLASSASNANNGTAISLSSGAAGGSHTLNIAFDGTNTKFKATYGNGTKAKISRAGQLLISINGVLQQAQESSTPTLGFGLDSDSTIVFSQAPVSTDVLFGQILADTITNFDTQDNTLDVFTGDGSTVNFNLSKKPASNNDILVTLDGVVQYPTTTSTSNAYSVTESTLTFTAAPADGVAIQVRHIGFAGATSSAVTGLYGRTGNVTLSSSDDDITVGNVTAGIITATSFGSISGTTASFSGNVSIGGTLTYEDVTNIDAVGLITARSGVKFGTSGPTVIGDSTGIGVGTVTANAEFHVGPSGTNTRIRLTNDNTGPTSSDGFQLSIDANQNAYVYSWENANLIFGTNNSEAARFDSSGRLQIGASNNTGTNTKLVVGAGNNINTTAIINTGDVDVNALTLSNWDGSTTTNKLMMHFDSSGIGAFNIGMPAATDAFVIDDGGTERLRIDSSGNMGLGTNSPTTGNSGARFIHIHNTGTDTNRPSEIVFTNGVTGTTGGNGGTITYYQDDLYTWNYEAQDLIFGTNATERMRIDSSGRLLLGTTTEGEHTADDLTVATSGDTGISIRSGTSSSGRLFFSDGTSSADEYRGFVQYVHSNNSMLFGTDATERLRIDSSGRVLIGTTTEGHEYADDFTVANSGGNCGMTIRSGTSSVGSIYFSDATSGAAEYDGWIDYNQQDRYIRFGTAQTERLRIDAAGRLLAGSTATWDASIDHQFRALNTNNWALNANSTSSGGPNHLLITTGRDSSGDNMIRVETNHGALGGAGTTLRFKVSGGGVIFATNTTISSASDERLKENIRDSEDGLAIINQLRPVRFDWRQDQTFNEGTNQLGFIAQEVESVFPEAVGITPLPSDFAGDDPEYKTVGPGAFIPVLVKALQEASAKIETLEAKVAALEG